MFSMPRSQSYSPWFSENDDPKLVHARKFYFNLIMFSVRDLDSASSNDQPFSQGHCHPAQVDPLSLSQ